MDKRYVVEVSRSGVIERLHRAKTDDAFKCSPAATQATGRSSLPVLASDKSLSPPCPRYAVRKGSGASASTSAGSDSSQAFDSPRVTSPQQSPLRGCLRKGTETLRSKRRIPVYGGMNSRLVCNANVPHRTFTVKFSQRVGKICYASNEILCGGRTPKNVPLSNKPSSYFPPSFNLVQRRIYASPRQAVSESLLRSVVGLGQDLMTLPGDRLLWWRYNE
eukprot:GHVU01165395.1.p1 GENE.GHVU01165395.1~~GHVU01165395.1.p1  ORF type:complete len:219 (+),score=14.45 GHVU01165395.1:63-719(+)